MANNHDDESGKQPLLGEKYKKKRPLLEANDDDEGENQPISGDKSIKQKLLRVLKSISKFRISLIVLGLVLLLIAIPVGLYINKNNSSDDDVDSDNHLRRSKERDKREIAEQIENSNKEQQKSSKIEEKEKHHAEFAAKETKNSNMRRMSLMGFGKNMLDKAIVAGKQAGEAADRIKLTAQGVQAQVKLTAGEVKTAAKKGKDATVDRVEDATTI